MRIIGEIPHPAYKITLFYHNDRYSVQIEHGVYSQVYRVRQGKGLEAPADAFKLVDPEFLQGLTRVFEGMHDLWVRQISRLEASLDKEEFEHIL